MPLSSSISRSMLACAPRRSASGKRFATPFVGIAVTIQLAFSLLWASLTLYDGYQLFDRSMSMLPEPTPVLLGPPEDLPRVGLCMMVKGSEPYLQESIDYNLAIGFHEIYIIDNSEDNDFQHLKLHPQQIHSIPGNRFGRVHSVLHFPGSKVQLQAYDMCVERFGDRVEYMAFFDDDEFLVMRKHTWIGELVRGELVHPVGAVRINWRNMGTNNHTLYSPIPILKRFQHRITRSEFDSTVKSIVRIDDYDSCENPHNFNLKNKATYARVKGQDALLFHYKYKSVNEYKYKSCVRKSTFRSEKGCGDETPSGDFFDDSAWRILKERVPWYATFDERVDTA